MNPSAPPPAGENGDAALRQYGRVRLDLAAQVRLLREAARRTGRDAVAERCAALGVRLAEDRFTLAVLGQFSRGKSSLLNALVGRDALPIGILPLTSTITVLRHGSAERLLIERSGWSLPEERPLADLPEFVSERGNPGNRRGVTAAYVELPAAILRRGLHLVDTPGVGSRIQANTATTYAFLPECDAALFVTSAEAPLHADELRFLREVRKHASKFFFAVAKADLLTDAQRAEVLTYVSQVLRDETGVAEPRVFAVSALQARAAQQQMNGALLARSGLLDLQAALGDFLAQERGLVFLLSILDKLGRLLRSMWAEEEIGRQARGAGFAARRELEVRLDGEMRRLRERREQALRSLREDGQRELGSALDSIVDAFFAERAEKLRPAVCRLLAHCGRASVRAACRRVSAAAERSLLRSAQRDLHSRLQGAAAAGIVPLDTKHPGLGWAELSSAPARICGLARSAANEGDGPALPAVSLSLDAPAGSPWTSAPSGLVAWMPAAWRKRTVAAFLVREGRDWLERQREAWKAELRPAIQKALAARADQLRAAASELEHRGRDLIAAGGRVANEDETLGRIRTHLLGLREEIVRIGIEASPADWDPGPITIGRFGPPADPAAARPDPGKSPASRLASDLRIRGCAVCSHLARDGLDFLSHWQYELFTREPAQEEFAGDGGFCSRHQWQLEALSSPVGISVGQTALVRRVASRLRQGESPSAPRCRACLRQAAAERAYVGELAAFVQSADGRAAYAQGQSLCRRHLAQLTGTISDAAVVRFLVDHASARLLELADEMESFGLKTEALRRQLRNRDEEDAYLRATILLSGSRSLCQPWPADASTL